MSLGQVCRLQQEARGTTMVIATVTETGTAPGIASWIAVATTSVTADAADVDGTMTTGERGRLPKHQERHRSRDVGEMKNVGPSYGMRPYGSF